MSLEMPPTSALWLVASTSPDCFREAAASPMDCFREAAASPMDWAAAWLSALKACINFSPAAWKRSRDSLTWLCRWPTACR